MGNLSFKGDDRPSAFLRNIAKNTFGRYISVICAVRGITKQSICNNIGISRPTLSRIEKEQIKQITKRKKIIDKIAAVLYDNANKLLFISGINPWIDCLDINDLVAVWEFVERIVLSKKQGKVPPAFYYTTLISKMFGGASIVDNEKATEFLHSIAVSNTNNKEKGEDKDESN